MLALKCVYTLLKKNKLIDRQELFTIVSRIKTGDNRVNLHLLKIFNELAQEASIEQLVEVYVPLLSSIMLRTTHRAEFEVAEALWQCMMGKVKEQRLRLLTSGPEEEDGGQAADFLDERRFLLAADEREMELAAEATESECFGYLGGERMQTDPASERKSCSSLQAKDDDSEYEYSKHFGRKSSETSHD